MFSNLSTNILLIDIYYQKGVNKCGMFYEYKKETYFIHLCAVVKNPPASAGGKRDMCLNPWSERSPE